MSADRSQSAEQTSLSSLSSPPAARPAADGSERPSPSPSLASILLTVPGAGSSAGADTSTSSDEYLQLAGKAKGAAPPAKQVQGQGNMLSWVLASSASGVLSRIPTHPFDTIKAKMQVQTASSSAAASGGPYTSVADAMRRTFRSEGLKGLYQGFGIAFWGSAPALCLYFTSYEYSRQWMRQHVPVIQRNPFFADFCGGLVAEVFSCVVWVPIDVVKERLQVQSNMSVLDVKYTGNMHALRTILATEGLRGIYRGYGATVASFGPFSAFYLMIYQQLKDLGLRVRGQLSPQKRHTATEVELPFAYNLFNGAAAGGLAAVITNPLDMAKLRLQVQRRRLAAGASPTSSGGFGFNYRNVVDGVTSIARHEGPAALFRGVSARILFQMPSAAITMSLYEECRKFFDHLLRTS